MGENVGHQNERETKGCAEQATLNSLAHAYL